MELFLSRNSTRNTTLVDASGTTHYKIDSPFKFFGRMSTIRKVVRKDLKSNVISDSSSSSSLLEKHSGTTSGNSILCEKATELAVIRWRHFVSSSLKFGAIEVDMSEYMPSQGFSRRTRAFHGPDGRPYKWRLGLRNSFLAADDDLKTPIARTHRRCYGFLGKSRRASLEIFPAGQHMTDTVVVTWCYVETLRRRREK